MVSVAGVVFVLTLAVNQPMPVVVDELTETFRLPLVAVICLICVGG